MDKRRPVSYKEYDAAQNGYCLLLTGGMMSPPIALIERRDGSVAQIPVENIQFLDADAWKEAPNE